LEFRFTGLGPDLFACQEFRYKLEGSESDWNVAGDQKRAVYLHVPPGKYTFRVRARSRDGVWNENDILLRLIMQPHYYQTASFKVGVSLLAGAGLVTTVVLMMRRRMRARMEHLERQRALDRERTRIAQDLHDELGAGLTEIGLLSGLLQNPSRFTERNLPALERIATRCRGLVAALDEIVWAVNPRNDSVDSLSNYFCLYAQGFLEPSSIRCWLEVQDVESPRSLNSEQRHNLFLAFKEALTNVVRHSGASEVRIKIFLKDSTQVVLCVEDNGHGLPATVSGGSDGLINLRQRMERIGGHCEISNLPGGGVSVFLNLPLLESYATK
jgi:signal transduction histidine kinase